ncbi:MAG: DUF5830 family protein [Halapricum sp.]
MPDRETVELGVELLSRVECEELSVASAIDRIETVTTDPRTTREILEAAEARGVVEREGSRLRRGPAGGGSVQFEREVYTAEGEFTCARCGSGLSTGYFIDLEHGDVGPFGSSCIRKVTGRE